MIIWHKMTLCRHPSRSFSAQKPLSIHKDCRLSPKQRKTAPLQQEEFQSLTGLPPDICTKLSHHLDLVARWRQTGRLMSARALADPWRRHILDSWNLFNLLPSFCQIVVDIGSGAGFPGLPLALMGSLEIHLIESNHRKAAFLAAAIRCLQLNSAYIHAQRAETMRELKADAVCARAVAPIEHLITLTLPFLRSGTVCLFPQGKNHNRSVLTDRIDTTKFKSDLISNPFDKQSGGILRLIAH